MHIYGMSLRSILYNRSQFRDKTIAITPHSTHLTKSDLTVWYLKGKRKVVRQTAKSPTWDLRGHQWEVWHHFLFYPANVNLDLGGIGVSIASKNVLHCVSFNDIHWVGHSKKAGFEVFSARCTESLRVVEITAYNPNVLKIGCTQPNIYYLRRKTSVWKWHDCFSPGSKYAPHFLEHFQWST